MTAVATRPANRWAKFLAVVRLPNGWWLDASALDADGERELWGPYDSRSEAIEARRSYLRNAISKPWLKDPEWQALQRKGVR